MHKTISVTLAGLVFHIEEPAYQKLDAYLTAVKNYFAGDEGSEEIITDIESRFAEQFTSKVNANKNVIALAEVEAVIKNMGSVEEMDEFIDETKTRRGSEEKDTRIIKRLYRNPDDQILGGVASGLAAYFGIDPVIVRILFVLLTLAWGTSIVAYILLWLLMPEAKTPSQKYEMRGEKMTLKKIEETVKKAFPEKNNNADQSAGAKREGTVAGRFIRKFFVILGKVIRVFLLIVAGIVGVAFMVAGIAALIGTTIIFVTLLVNPNAPYFDFPLAEFAYGTAEYFVLLVCGFIVVIVPMLLLFSGGLAILKRKKILRTGLTVALIATWIVAIGLGSAFGSRVWPSYQQRYNELAAQQETNEKVFEVGDFGKISLGGGHEIHLMRGDVVSVKAYGVDRELERLNLVTADGVLKTGYSDSWNGRICIFCFTKPARIEITTPTLSAVNFSGAVKVNADNFESEDFSLKLSGASRYTGELKAEDIVGQVSGASFLTLTSSASSTAKFTLTGASKLVLNSPETASVDLDMSGASSATLTGAASQLLVKLSGASRLLASEFIVGGAYVDASGSSRGELNALDTLEVKASGASAIDYYGRPEETIFDTSGSSKVRAR